MSSFTNYLLKAVVTAAYLLVAATATTTTAGEEEEEVENHWSPFKNELNFRLAALGGGLVTMVAIFCMVEGLLRCCDLLPDFPIHQQAASIQQAPPCRRIILLEPALTFTSGLTLAGGADHPECAICLSEFVEGEDIRILSNCRHGFHHRCIQPWLLSDSSSCPICRTSVNQNPPENHQQQQQQLPNDVDLEAAANPPGIEMMVQQQQQPQPQQQQQPQPNL